MTPQTWELCGHDRHPDDDECLMCEKLEWESVMNQIAEEDVDERH